MGYPTGVFNPATRSNGQTIDAGHVNDLQTEVSAIETALLGTITHSVNVSGASTLATLSAGASTLTTLSVSGGSTFAVRPVMPPPALVKVTVTSSVTIASSALSTIAWTERAIVTNSSLHESTVNPSRLVPDSTGVWEVIAQLGTNSPSSGMRAVSIIDSSGSQYGACRVTNSTKNLRLQAVAVKNFDVTGGYFTIVFETDAGSTHSLEPGIAETWASLRKL